MTVSLFGTRVVLLLTGTLASVVIARALGPDGRGEYAVIVSIVSVAIVVGHCSVEQAQVYLSGLNANLRSMAANAVALGVGLSAPIVGLTLLTVELLSFPASGTHGGWDLPIAMMAIPASLVVLWSNGLLVLQGRIKALNLAMLIGGLGQFVALMAVATLGEITVTWVIAIWTANAFAPLLVILPALRPRWRDIDKGLARRAVTYGLRYHPAQLGLYLLLRADILILAAMTDSATVGLYALAVTLIELTNVATDAVSTAIIHRQAHLPMIESAKFTARAVGVSGVLATVAVTGLLLLSPLMVPSVFGSEFSGAVPALASLAPGVAALAMTRSAGSFLLRQNRPVINGFLASVALIINLLLNLWLIPQWGIVGCGIASSFAYLFLGACYLTWLVKAGSLRAGDFWPLTRTVARP